MNWLQKKEISEKKNQNSFKMGLNKKERTRSNLRIFGGTSHPSLTKAIARRVGVRVGELTLKKFANNETNVGLQENVRGQVI